MQITRGALEESLKIYAPLYLVRPISSSPRASLVWRMGQGVQSCSGGARGTRPMSISHWEGSGYFWRRWVGWGEIARGGYPRSYGGREKGEGN